MFIGISDEAQAEGVPSPEVIFQIDGCPLIPVDSSFRYIFYSWEKYFVYIMKTNRLI